MLVLCKTVRVFVKILLRNRVLIAIIVVNDDLPTRDQFVSKTYKIQIFNNGNGSVLIFFFFVENSITKSSNDFKSNTILRDISTFLHNH